MSSDIGLPSLTIEPATRTLAARVAADLASATIRAGVFDATPLPAGADPPQPASVAAASAASATRRASATAAA